MEIEETTSASDEAGKKEGASFPYKTLESTINFVKKVYEDLGHNLYHSRDQIAALFNLAPNSIKQPVSAAQQFGLLEIKHGIGYKTTDLFASILLPGNEDEKKKSILESIRKPYIYNELLMLYERSGILPNNTGLSNTLQRNFKFNEDSAQRVAKDFVGTLKEYGFLDDKNILRLNMRPASETINKTTHPVVEFKPKPESESNERNNDDENGLVKILIPFGKSGEGRNAYILLPKDYTNKDLKKVGKFITALVDDDE